MVVSCGEEGSCKMPVTYSSTWVALLTVPSFNCSAAELIALWAAPGAEIPIAV